VESQNLEWKRKWREEFLKGRCGLANAQGGVLEIGRDDNGAVAGIDNARELLKELPNTIRHALGMPINDFSIIIDYEPLRRACNRRREIQNDAARRLCFSS